MFVPPKAIKSKADALALQVIAPAGFLHMAG
jgi:hypothetical protein